MYIIGLTGGIGSGKTAASQFFEALGVCVVDADVVAREVVQPGTQALWNIAEHFGESILQIDGTLDRKKLRSVIFSTPSEKVWLEQLLHPIIRKETIRQLKAAHSDYSILVSPLLFETDQHQLTQRTLLIDVPEDIQLERAAKRDDNQKEQIQKIIDSQLSRKTKQQRADDIISNHLSLSSLKLSIEKQHKIYLELAHEQRVKG